MPYKNKEDGIAYKKRRWQMLKEKGIAPYRYYGKDYVNEKRWMKNFSLSLKEVDELLIKQGHKCPICNRSLKENKRCLDHDHKTMKVRGILCAKCNTGLGMFSDNINLLEKALTYLER